MKKLAQAEHLPIDKLKPFEGHPFYVKDDDDMELLTESIRSQGVLTPLVVRPLPNDEYEVISGHRPWSFPIWIRTHRRSSWMPWGGKIVRLPIPRPSE